jgi:hypothetical protein
MQKLERHSQPDLINTSLCRVMGLETYFFRRFLLWQGNETVKILANYSYYNTTMIANF